jgi:Ca2+-binding RTX toxin-like protein
VRRLALSALGVFCAVLLSSSGSRAESTFCLGRQATIVVRSNGGSVKGTPIADVIAAKSGRHTVYGRGGNDRICAGQGNDRILGGGGNDRIDAGDGHDVIEGENGSDRLFGGGGTDIILGNRGNDRIDAEEGSEDFADGRLGDDSVLGGAGSHDRVVGGVGNDRLKGGAGGEDVLRGDHGADLFDGGEGEHDVASFAVSGFDGPIEGGQGVIVDLVTGRASQDGADRLMKIEDVIGTAFNDSLRGSTSENALYGGGGDDRLKGVGPRDRALGGAGSDTCEGVEQADSCGVEAGPSGLSVEVAVAGGSGRGSLTVIGREPRFAPGPVIEIVQKDISIEVGFEADEWTVVGGPQLRPGEGCTAVGEEVRCPIVGGPDAVLVSGNSGHDRLVLKKIVPASVVGILQGDAGSDLLLGGRGDDSLNGGAKDSSSRTDVLKGGGGDDAVANGKVLLGEGGSDLLIASPCTGQRVEGGSGVDSVSFARSYLGLGVRVRLGGSAVFPAHKFGREFIPAGCSFIESESSSIGDSIESIEGSPKEDVLIGDEAPNILLGRGGDDLVLGEAGDDFLVGGTGRDEIRGGRGNDRLYAQDGKRDQRLYCGPMPTRLDVAKLDSADPPAAGCRVLPF